MMNEILHMNGYGIYVWSAFSFTLLSFTSLYVITKIQFIKEQRKFVTKFGTLSPEKATSAKLQNINKDILSNASKI
jgi:heme exporter protein D